MNRVRKLLGPALNLAVGLSDQCSALSPNDKKRILRKIEKMQHLFPQVGIHILIRNLPTDHPFDLYTFWIFNSSGISSDASKGGSNHNTLIVLDPIQGKSSIMIGYGLEPFCSDQQLDGVLETGRLAWSDRAWADGILAALDGLESMLRTSLDQLKQAFDLDPYRSRKTVGDY